MKGGFSFCGVDIADIGLEYAPENKDTYVYAPAVANVHEETFDGHDGGYAYGAYKQPKEFTLRCFYQDEHIAKGVMAKAYNLFKVGKKGMLIFKRRPWCYYYATVTNIDTSEMYSYLNGLFVVTLKAYYPFARGLEINDRLFCNVLTDPYHTEIMANTALLDHEGMLPPMTFNSAPNNTVLLFNPGTERAKVSLVISGQVGDEAEDGVTIFNKTTQQSCRYIAFNTEDNDYIYTDGINGKTVLDHNGTKKLAFLYHDYGFIELEPSFPSIRDLFISYSNNTVNVTNKLYDEQEEREWYIGKYIFLGSKTADNTMTGNWRKIMAVPDKHTFTVSGNTGNGSHRTTVALMNEITVTPQNTEISKLSFIYKPTFA